METSDEITIESSMASLDENAAKVIVIRIEMHFNIITRPWE